MNTELIGVSYYDLGEKQELVGNMNVRELDESYVSLPRVVECAGNIMQAVHPSHLGIDDRPALSVRREVVFGNGRKLDIYVEIEANMEAPEELNYPSDTHALVKWENPSPLGIPKFYIVRI